MMRFVMILLAACVALSVAAASTQQQIPKTLHQIWLSDAPEPKIWHNTWRTWCAANNVEYKLWSAESLRAQLDAEDVSLIDRVLALQNVDDAATSASDVARLAVLNKFGGVFVDSDIVAQRQFTSVELFSGCASVERAQPPTLKAAAAMYSKLSFDASQCLAAPQKTRTGASTSSFFVGYEAQRSELLGNGVIGAVAQHPLLRATLLTVRAELDERRALWRKPQQLTGSAVLTATLSAYFLHAAQASQSQCSKADIEQRLDVADAAATLKLSLSDERRSDELDELFTKTSESAELSRVCVLPRQRLYPAENWNKLQRYPVAVPLARALEYPTALDWSFAMMWRFDYQQRKYASEVDFARFQKLEDYPVVSAIVVLGNSGGSSESDNLRLALSDVAEQDYPWQRLEVVIADRAAACDVEQHKTLVESTLKGIAYQYVCVPSSATTGAARNAALKATKGSIVAHFGESTMYAPRRVRVQVRDLLASEQRKVNALNFVFSADGKSGQFFRREAEQPQALLSTLVYRKTAASFDASLDNGAELLKFASEQQSTPKAMAVLSDATLAVAVQRGADEQCAKQCFKQQAHREAKEWPAWVDASFISAAEACQCAPVLENVGANVAVVDVRAKLVVGVYKRYHTQKRSVLQSSYATLYGAYGVYGGGIYGVYGGAYGNGAYGGVYGNGAYGGIYGNGKGTGGMYDGNGNWVDDTGSVVTSDQEEGANGGNSGILFGLDLPMVLVMAGVVACLLLAIPIWIVAMRRRAQAKRAMQRAAKHQSSRAHSRSHSRRASRHIVQPSTPVYGVAAPAFSARNDSAATMNTDTYSPAAPQQTPNVVEESDQTYGTGFLTGGIASAAANASDGMYTNGPPGPPAVDAGYAAVPQQDVYINSSNPSAGMYTNA